LFPIFSLSFLACSRLSKKSFEQDSKSFRPEGKGFGFSWATLLKESLFVPLDGEEALRPP
jgi:hypothetical protein